MGFFLLCQPSLAWAGKTDEVPGVDLKDLDADEKKLLIEVLDNQFDPCGKPRSFLDALKDKGSCGKAIPLATFAVGRVQEGLSKRQVVRALLKELKRMTVRHKFTIKGRPSIGPDKAKVTVVEFSDFECPHCKEVSRELKKLIKGRDVRIVFKQYPLQFHQNALPAAIAVVAAHFQGKFWPLYERLFADQDKLSEKYIQKLAKKVGLDMKRFKVDQASATSMVEDDRTEGELADIEGTPTFFVDGQQVEFEDLDSRIKAALKRK